MDEALVVHATDGDQLADVDVPLHDAAFSMADIRFDQQRGVVQISFKAPRVRDLSFRRRSGGVEPFADRLLTISNVASINIEDPAGLIEHSYARIVNPETGRLTLVSNFPGQVDFVVSAIDLRVTT
ncbi:MAG: hypothetical protein ACJ76I_00030 [Gaiellaceae bacterium]